MTDAILDPVDLVTERLLLRRFRAEDAALVELYVSDARVARMTERIPHPYPPGMARGFVTRAAAGTPGEASWAIDAGPDTSGGLVGAITLRIAAPGSGRIGYWVAPAFWNTGYASEATAAVVKHAGRLGLSELTARVFQDNAASVRVLMHSGFDYTGDGEAYSVARGGMVPTHEYRREVSEEVAR
jgi:RimJ/RimL family protein N-acetyltransferase